MRIDRGIRSPAPKTTPAQQNPVQNSPQIRIIETPAFHVVVVVDAEKGRLSRFDRQLIGAARLFADAGEGNGAVIAVVPASTDDLGEAGADRVVFAGAGAQADASLYVIDLLALDEKLQARHWLFAETSRGGDLARRMAVKLQEPILTQIEHLTARQAVRASHAATREEAGRPPRLMTIEEDRVSAYADIACEARPISIETQPNAGIASAIIASRLIPGDPSSMPLAEADFVVSAGNGVTDFKAFYDLASALRATPGASRVVCDAGLMPREAQVGASGTVLAADCYFALGIAGAPQHLQGIAGCEHVIAVNTDLHAAMIERAGLAIVQDAQKVMPALLRLLEARRG
ncbi:electron transfer flavoprotein subunit alpha/FixB family protein [Notoacmeibacter sp. MSK16QG-6]|uniref:electron transfer flavoprotein subunit alpha/FixB family protein n=1 Tax=Notoacmeibacter sp. MSK16QG-6 TaxID=2957982 RepID=UPI00211104D3|nr:electron transfer flavoprotein subunit alpha/FixB family protein [Notoacmeibacter sp. MSK16QG-6]